MTTEELVTKLVDYIRVGQNVQAEEELYAEDVYSVEQNGYSTKGKQATIAKTKGAFESIEEVYAAGVEKVLVGSDSFILVFQMDVKPKGGERSAFTEYGFYKVRDGLVSEEYFFSQAK